MIRDLRYAAQRRQPGTKIAELWGTDPTGSLTLFRRKEAAMSTILLIVLILLLIGAVPTWPHSRSWGYFPSGILGIVVIVLIVMLLTGRI